jgi:hypothetical protein
MILILSETKSDDFFCLQNLLEELGFHLAVTVKPEQNGKIGDITEIRELQVSLIE